MGWTTMYREKGLSNDEFFRREFPTTLTERGTILVQGHTEGTAIVVPAVLGETGWVPMRLPSVIGPMAGGCFVATSDSRFSEAVEKVAGRRIYAALPLHDRFETQEQYEFLSRG